MGEIVGVVGRAIEREGDAERVGAVPALRGRAWMHLQRVILALPSSSLGSAHPALVWLVPVRLPLSKNGKKKSPEQVESHDRPARSPFIAQLARNRSLVGWTMPARLLALHYATAVLLRLPAIVFDISATQRLDFSPLARGRKADAYIIGALQSTDDYYLVSTGVLVGLFVCSFVGAANPAVDIHGARARGSIPPGREPETRV